LFNRRIKVLLYWLTKEKFNVSLIEIGKFIFKPKARSIALRYIDKSSQEGDFIKVSFHSLKNVLYWPANYGLDHLYQVCAETFDVNDWHRYECYNTEVSQDDVVVDVGAAEGLFSLSILGRCKKILIVEPNKLFVKALSKTFHDHTLQKVAIFNVATGDIEAKVAIREDDISSNITADSCGEEVQMMTLDALLKDKGPIDYIKADIEGYEIKMLAGAAETIKKYKPKMAITCYHADNDYQQIIDFVTGLVPEYKCILRGVTQFDGKPIMAHFHIKDK